MKGIFLILVSIIFVLVPQTVLAHSGRTDSSGGHNCSSKSISKGLCGGYHYHGGGGSTYTNIIPRITPRPTLKSTPLPTATPTSESLSGLTVEPTSTPAVMGANTASTSNTRNVLITLGVILGGGYYGIKWLGRKAAFGENS